MKKISTLFMGLIIALSAVAAPKVGLKRTLSPNPIKVENVKKALKAPKAVADEEAALVSGTYYTVGGAFYLYNSNQSTFVEATSYMPSVEVAVEGDQVTITGLAYWFKDGAVKGTMADNTITIPSGQLVGTDQYGDEYLVGSADGQTISNIVFTYDPATQTLTCNMYIIESESATSVNAYAYWARAAFSATQPETPEAIVVPEDLQTKMYRFEGIDTYDTTEVVKFVTVGFDADTVYVQGMSAAITDGWIKGVKDEDGSYVFEAVYLGLYESLFGNYDIYTEADTMVYDANLDKFTCASFVTTAEGYPMEEYKAITLSVIVEVAATPADPKFDDFVFADAKYPYVAYTIPVDGTQGEQLNPSKLSYMFFVQKGNESSPLVLTTDIYKELAADMTEIPYLFSDDYDVYNTRLYLNQTEEEVRSWEKLGLQTIYRGLDEEHKSNIVWYDVKAYWEAVDAQGIDNIDAAVKAAKVLRNGQLIIIKNGVEYNALGTIVK